MTTMTHPVGSVIGGVDTHGQTHTAAAITQAGSMLGTAQFPADAAGYRALTRWLSSHGTLDRVGVEGTGSYGAGLTRHLRTVGINVVEVNRPDRATRRRVGKSDPIDAEHAARAVLAGTATATPKNTTGPVEALRNLRVARRAAISHRADTIRRVKSVIATAPEALRAQLAGMPTRTLMQTLTASRPSTADAAAGDVTAAVKTALRSLARSWQQLTDEITDLDNVITPLVQSINPALLNVFGVGTDVAGQLIVTCGQNPDRLHSDAALAALCGASPVPASTGKTIRHRLNRGGDRHANNALWRIVITRMAHDPRTRDYVTRRAAEQRTPAEIIRCLKRHLCRELWPILTT
jgi:transposase